MLYREAGDFKTSYAKDNQTFPIRFDRWGYFALLAVAFLVVPFVINDYWASAVLLPFLIYSIAALGLNILTGYCGQVSLGTGGFMAVGAYSCYKLMTAFPEVSIVIHVLLAGGITAGVGLLFGLPSLRIKGFYLAVATLAAQFFLVWLFNKVGWFYNYSASGQISSAPRSVLGFEVTGPTASAAAKYLICLSFVVVMAWLARNLTRGSYGRKWMAIRDMDIAAEIIGLGSILGSFAGAAFIVLLPVFLKNVLVGSFGWATDLAAHLEIMTLGGLIMMFLILEPHGLAQYWRTTKEKLRLWPFPH
jgi:branched-chain amino acid transport system permease protein